MIGLTWTCHICKDERPDSAISVYHVTEQIKGLEFQSNVRYCNDRRPCIEAAPLFRFFKELTDG